MYRDFPIPVGELALGAGGAAATAGTVMLLGVDVPLSALIAGSLAVLGGVTLLARHLYRTFLS
jgi:hypothetical protein